MILSGLWPITIEPSRQNFFVIGIYVVFISLKPETARGNVTSQSDIATYFVVSRTLVVAQSENSYLSRNSYCRMHLAESRYFLSRCRRRPKIYTRNETKTTKIHTTRTTPLLSKGIGCNAFIPSFTCCVSYAEAVANRSIQDRIQHNILTTNFIYLYVCN